MESTVARKQFQCDEWNVAHAIGTSVRVRRDNGDVTATRTRSEAYLLSGHTPVIFLDGISGAYLLDRVTACEESTADTAAHG